MSLGVALVVQVTDTRRARQLSAAAMPSPRSKVDSPGIPSAAPTTTEIYKVWRLLPESEAKPWPDCVPEPLRQDYREACLIRDLSSKASATLSRRCLQGMIRDFCDISKKTLYAEITELKKQVDEGNAPKGVEHETMEAIDAVREVGNIGAHMEADIDVIVDVDPARGPGADRSDRNALRGLVRRPSR